MIKKKYKYYQEHHKFFEDKLTIFKKSVSQNWYGRVWIDGKGKELSSKTRNFKKAKTILCDWYRELTYKLKNEMPVHDLQFNKLFKQYIQFRKENKKTQYSKNIEITFNAIFRSYFHNKKINSINKKIMIGFISNRVKKFKKDNKKQISRFTILQDLMMISGFLNWTYDNKHKETRLHISKKWIDEVIGIKGKDTTRTYFSIDEYDKLLKTSRRRINATTHSLQKFRREYLHQFIIFMVHSGLRTGEAYNMKWKDVKFIDKGIRLDRKKHCVLNVSGKTAGRTVYTFFGSYFALKKIIQLKNIKHPLASTEANSRVFNAKFRKGLDSLLIAAKLKKSQFGDKELTRDSKSFRSTYISWSIIRGESIKGISLNCGTSAKVIQDFYTKYVEVKNFKKQLTEVSNVDRLHLNGHP
tara:strand:- start:2554 stop:3789 length:1236 start_codon:yes stop_codon:yes gene_type:complete